MSGRRSRTRRARSAADEGRSRSLVPYCPSAAAEGRRRALAAYAFRSLAPPGLPAYTPPPGFDAPASLRPSCSWPPTQSKRDWSVGMLRQKMVGPSLYAQRYGAVPEPEAERAAAAIEAEAFAAASQSASGANLDSHAERFAVYKTYLKESGFRLVEFFKSRAAALGDALEPGDSSATALPLLAASPSEE